MPINFIFNRYFPSLWKASKFSIFHSQPRVLCVHFDYQVSKTIFRICKGLKGFLLNEVWPGLSLFSIWKSLKTNTCILGHPKQQASQNKRNLSFWWFAVKSTSRGRLTISNNLRNLPNGLRHFIISLTLSCQLFHNCLVLWKWECLPARLRGVGGDLRGLIREENKAFPAHWGSEWILCRMLLNLAWFLPGSTLMIQPPACGFLLYLQGLEREDIKRF